MSALSILHDAQTRGIAAIQALASMRHEHEERNKTSPVSPSSMIGATLPTDPALYANIFAGANTGSIAMLTPSQMLAANLARFTTPNLYTHPIFSSWHLAATGNNTTSPPISPISPTFTVKTVKQINNNNNNNNNIVTTTTNEMMPNNNNDSIANNNAKIGSKIAANARKGAGGSRKAATYKKKRNQVSYHPYNGLDLPPQLVHDISPGPISPPTSGSSPQSMASLETHQSPSSSSVNATTTTTTTKDATRDKIFTCQTCLRSFGYKHVLQNHERTHTGEKPFACPQCDKRFTRDHHLKTHMRLHTGEKPYHCPHCDRQFVQVANLRRHTRVHTGEKPYSCKQCDSKFSDSNQLKAHEQIHSNEKPFHCDTCNTSFRRNKNLVQHKCNINSPPTPAMSPAMSIDNKSATSHSTSDHSIELGSPNVAVLKQIGLQQQHQQQQQQQQQQPIYNSILLNEMPLDLSVDDSSERRNRKSHDVRHILRMPTQIMHVPTEQTEPEDLSMHSPRSASPMLNDDDFSDLDDAESLNRKQTSLSRH